MTDPETVSQCLEAVRADHALQIKQYLNALLAPGSYSALAGGLLGALSIVFRAQKDFHAEKQIIKDPWTYAVGPSVTAAKFRENSWQAFRALCAAQEFHSFYRRFKPLLDGHTALIYFTLGTLLALFLFVLAWLMGTGLPLHGLVGHVYLLFMAWWSVLVHRGAALSAATDVLRVT